MSYYLSKTGSLIWIIKKIDSLKEAVDIWEASRTDQAALNVAIELSELIGIGIPVFYLDKMFTKTGLDRVFDSLKKNKSFQDYLESQALAHESLKFGAGEIAEWSLHELVNLISEYRIFDDVFSNFIKAGIPLNLRDPLALDLNGDGITTLSANEEILFDHNNSGIRYGTGWINPQDGWLALDRNGNGQIDSGRELFGDSTRKLYGNLAAHAYDALKSFDTNNDGQVDSADATGDTNTNGMIDGNETYWDINNNDTYDEGIDKTFADLRVWVDANSNGETDSGELKTLAELGIVSISTGKTAVNVTDANGNVNTFVGNYTKTTGDVVDGTRSFNLVQNTFHNAPSSSVNIPPGVAALPNVQGSGAVRDLHQAMSLGTVQSATLKATVEAFAAANTRSAQYALIDKLLMEWASTSAFQGKAAANDSIGGQRQQGCRRASKVA